ncbi:MAG: type II toxin-antitoxin system RelE/ParE family toxin [Salinivirgaceae bacterium]
MRNTYKLVWTDEALNGLKDIIDYLERKFPEKDIKKFAEKFDRQIELIKKNPESFTLSPKSKTIRRSVVAKLTSIYYRIDGDTITLVTIYDNRKNPDDLRI